MMRRVGNRSSKSRSSNTDTTRTKRICLGFLAVAIFTIFYVNFLKKLDQLGIEVEEASKGKMATVTVHEDVKDPQLSYTVYDQQESEEKSNEGGYSAVDTNVGSEEEVKEEDEQTPDEPESADEEELEDDTPEESADEEKGEKDVSSPESSDGEKGVEDEDNVSDESVDEEDQEVRVEVQQNNTAVVNDTEADSGSNAILSTLVTTVEIGTNSTHAAETSAAQCKVLFKNKDMKICHFIPYDGNFGDELGPAAILKILENKFYPCSVKDIPVLNLRNARQPKDKCLFNLGSIFHFVQTGDHVWGTGTYRLPRYSS
jgi:hypothetical protein